MGEISFLAGLKTFLLGSIWTKFTKWTHEFEEPQSALGAIELSRQVGAEMDVLKSGVCFSLILFYDFILTFPSIEVLFDHCFIDF